MEIGVQGQIGGDIPIQLISQKEEKRIGEVKKNEGVGKDEE